MRSFVKQIAAVLLVVWILGGYPIYLWKGTDVLIAAGIGCAICTLNALAGAWLALWGMRRDNRTFMTVVFGGMGIRPNYCTDFLFRRSKISQTSRF